MTINYERRFGSIPLPLCSWKLPERKIDALIGETNTAVPICPTKGTMGIDEIVIFQTHKSTLVGEEINAANIRLDNKRGLNRLFPLCVYSDQFPRHPKK